MMKVKSLSYYLTYRKRISTLIIIDLLQPLYCILITSLLEKNDFDYGRPK
jgi:hypothetical protein